MRLLVVAFAALTLMVQGADAGQAAPAGQRQGRSGAQRPAAPRGGAAPAATQAKKSPDAGPVIVFETAKGNFEIETYPNEAPKSVDHILALVRRNFYNGLRVHRVVRGLLVQFGDPQTRDMTKQDRWGSGGSGNPIGVAEFNKKRSHVLGAVALAHAGDAKYADSQMYIMLTPQPKLDGSYTVIGKVISGMDVVRSLEKPDVIRRATIRPEAPATK